MKKTARLFFLLFVTALWSQPKIYEFDMMDMKTPDGWDLTQMCGEIQIDDKNKEITLITSNFIFVYDVFSKQQFFSVESYLYNAYDWRGEKIRIKINKIDDESKYLNFYFYSDETDMIQFRLCLTKCSDEI